MNMPQPEMPPSADVVHIERFRASAPHVSTSTTAKAKVLIFPVAAQVDVVRRTATALSGANDHRRNLTFRLWRDGINRQARRFGQSKRWATAQWEDFQKAVRAEIEQQSTGSNDPREMA